MDERLKSIQVERYEQIFKLFREYKDIIDAFTFWAVADDYTWLNNFPVYNRKNCRQFLMKIYNQKNLTIEL